MQWLIEDKLLEMRGMRVIVPAADLTGSSNVAH